MFNVKNKLKIIFNKNEAILFYLLSNFTPKLIFFNNYK